MKLFKNMFNRKLSWEQHSFTGIVAAGERIVIFCPEGSDQTTKILSHILSWKDHFKQISIILSDYDYTFFKRIDRDETTTFFNINNRIRPFNNSVILNFSSDRKIRDVFDHCKNSTILDVNNSANMQFIPPPTDPLTLLKKFANFFDFSWERYQYKVDVTNSELMAAKHQFINNRFKNFILDFSNEISAKKIEKIVHAIKHDFSANVYFTGKKINNKDFINIEEIQVANLLELYSLANVSDFFITDRPEIAEVFAGLDVDQIFLGKSLDNKSLKCVEQDNVVDMINIIKNILNK